MKILQGMWFVFLQELENHGTKVNLEVLFFSLLGSLCADINKYGIKCSNVVIFQK